MRNILVLLPAISFAYPITSSESCKIPNDFESMLAVYQAKDTLSVILPFPIQRHIDMLNKRLYSNVDDAERGPDQLLYGEKICPDSTLPEDATSLEERSTCPYYYVISNDPSRYPIAIAEARCKCTYCLDDNAGENLCEPIYFPMTVLRRQNECINGTYEYKPQTYYVQNACVCARRHFVLSPSADQNEGQERNEHNGSEEDRSSNKVNLEVAVTTEAPRFTFA